MGLTGFALSLLLAGATGVVLDASGPVDDPLLAAVVLCATSLGLVIGVLKEAGEATSTLGQLVICGASIGDFAAIILLSALFSTDEAGTGARLVLLVEYAVLVAAIGLAVGLAGRAGPVRDLLVRLQDTTAEIRVRGAVLLVVVLVVLAERFGLETILGAFVAGAVVGLVDRDEQETHPHFRLELDAIGYGFLVPVFFVSSGVNFDLGALRDDSSTLALVPIFLVAPGGRPGGSRRGVPAAGRGAGALAAGMLQATSLAFIVTATMVGVEIDALTPATAAAFVAAGLVSALAFPAVATSALASQRPEEVRPGPLPTPEPNAAGRSVAGG